MFYQSCSSWLAFWKNEGLKCQDFSKNVTNVIDVDKWVYFPAYCLGAKVTFYRQNWDLSNHSLLWNSNMKYAWGKSTLENSKFLAFSWVIFNSTHLLLLPMKKSFWQTWSMTKKSKFCCNKQKFVSHQTSKCNDLLAKTRQTAMLPIFLKKVL